MFDSIVHRWLHIPYTLQVRENRHVKRPRATVLFIHGIGNSGAAWNEVIDRLPDDIHSVTIDLLGFGGSPRPAWAIYNTKTQARSILATYLKLRLTGKVIIVGHSLGALVAVEIAKRYPLLVKSLILCSPPFYRNDEIVRRPRINKDRVLKNLYVTAKNHPDQFVALAGVALKLGLLNSAFTLTHEDAPIYMNALEASIVNQTSLNDAIGIRTPVHVIYGRLDPVVLLKNLRHLQDARKNVTLEVILASHEVRGNFIPAVVSAIKTAAQK